jgi:RNA polymerase sigma factor (sigma-70 family)
MATIAPEVPVLARDEAFEQLYRQYVKDVYHYALALLRNPADAEDVTQTTFMNAYRAFRRGDEILKPQNWLIKIAHNVARSRYSRVSRRVKEVPLDDHIDQLAMPEDERPNVEAVLRALGRLPFNQRAALVMRELEGRSYVEIADTLGVSVAAVETLIFRARRSLRVRAAALKSITAVPLPASLTQLFGGGGAVAGGIGAGIVVKAVVALVAGAVATGLGGDRSNRADAAGGTQPAGVVSSAHGTAATGSTTAGTGAGRLAGSKPGVRVRTVRTSRPDGLQRPGVTGSSPRAGAPAASANPSQASSSSSSTPVKKATAAAAAAATTTTAAVEDTVDTTVATVQEAVTTTAAVLPVKPPPPPPVKPPPLPVKPPPLPVQPPPLPVNPPPLPVQPPPLPKLP